MIGKMFGLIFKPKQTWNEIADVPEANFGRYLIYPILMSLIPAICWYIGTTAVGWRVGNGDIIRLTTDSALAIAVLFYCAELAAIVMTGYFVHWMASTYGAESSLVKGIVIVGFTVTPLMLSGLVGLHPIFTLDMLIGILAIAHSVYLLYIGIPIVMSIPEERGFLFASAVIAVGLVGVIVVMVGTVILWDFGFTPSFTD